MPAFLGPYEWRRQRAPERAAPGIVPAAYYQRFTIAQIRAGALATWLKTLPPDAIVGIRIQELVSGSTALPTGHGLPGAYDSGIKSFIPDYNSPAWFVFIRATLQTVADQVQSYALGRVDIAYGNWGEGHLYGLGTTLAGLKPTDESLRRLFATYTELFPASTLYAPIGNDTLLQAAHTAGIRGTFCDGWGLINNDGGDHAERYWLNPARAAILADMQIVGETGSATPARLNFQWMADSIERHKNVVAFGNGNIPYATLTIDQKALFVRCLTLVTERRAAILATPSIHPELVAARAEIERLTLIVSQQIATNVTTANALDHLIASNADSAAILNQIAAMMRSRA